MKKYGLQKIYTLYIVLLPIVNVYAAPVVTGLGMGELIGIFLCTILTIDIVSKYKGMLKISNILYWIFIFYMIFISWILTFILPEYTLSETVIRTLKLIFYTFNIFALAPKYFDFQLALKICINVSVIASIYLLIQNFVYLTSGSMLPVVIPGTNVIYTGTWTSEAYNALVMRKMAFGYRPCGFFLEPSYFCQYTVYSVLMLLMKPQKEKFDYLELVIISVAILLTKSALGYVCFVLMWCAWFVCSFKKRKLPMNVVIIICIILVLLIAEIRFGFAQAAIERVATVLLSGTSTGTVRLLRGFIVFSKLPLIYKIIGIGAGNYGGFIRTYNIVTMFDTSISVGNEYMNSVSTIMVYTGIIGSVLYGIAIYRIFKKSCLIQKLMGIIWIVIMFSESNFFTASYAFPLILISSNWKTVDIER